MKYTELVNNDELIELDYVTPMWIPFVEVVMAIILIGTGVIMFMGESPWYAYLILPLLGFILWMYLIQYRAKRKIVINKVTSEIEFDDKKYKISEIKCVEECSYANRDKIGEDDKKAPGLVSAKQHLTTYMTAIVFKDGSTLRVYLGFPMASKSEKIRFERYLGL